MKIDFKKILTRWDVLAVIAVFILVFVISYLTFFTPNYYRREIPVWTTYDPTGVVGEVQSRSPRWLRVVFIGVIVGVILGLMLLGLRSVFRRS